MIFWPKLPLWTNVPVKKMLEDRYKTLVQLEDTSRTRAFAEYRPRLRGRRERFHYVAVGAGIGAALFLDGRLYSGAGGFAASSAILRLRNGRLCSCGNRGCLETLVSARPSPEARARFVGRLKQHFDGDPREMRRKCFVEMLGQAARTATLYCATAIGSRCAFRPQHRWTGESPESRVNCDRGRGASAVGGILLPEIEPRPFTSEP